MVPGSPTDDQGKGSSAPGADLAQHIAQAEVVISGTASSVAPFESQAPGGISMHNPDWWQATIDVDSVIKGNVPGKTATVLFAHSSDVMWYRSPKIAVGDHRVFLLHRTDHTGNPTPGLAVVDALDSLPVTDLPKVQALMKGK
jgi:hypothetical protein